MRNHASRSRVWWIVVAVLVLAGIVAYFLGGATERTARARDVAVAQQQYTQISALRSVNHLLSASVWTYRALISLDNRNFGTANDAVARAVTELNGVDAPSAGLDSKEVSRLRVEAAAVKISVATNLEGQRAQLIQLASSITALAEGSTIQTEQTP